MKTINLKQLTKIMDVSISDIANKLGCSRPTVYRMLKNPESLTYNDAKIISDMLKVDISVLFGEHNIKM